MADYSNTGSLLTGITTEGQQADYYPDFSILASTVVTGSAGLPIPIYRGKLLGEYVYSTGTPPPGATDIVIIGYN